MNGFIVSSLQPKSMENYLSQLPTISLQRLTLSLLNRQLPNEFPKEDYHISILSFGNNKNYKITNIETGKSQVLSITEVFNPTLALDKATSKTLQENGVFAKKHVDKRVKLRNKVYTVTLTDYFNKASLQDTLENENSIGPELYKQCNQRMQKMATAFEKLQNKNVVFPDAKNSNWMVDDNDELFIADTKSLVELNDKGRVKGAKKDFLLWKTMGYIPDELSRNKIPYKEAIDADKVHSYILGANLYNYLTGDQPPNNLQDRTAYNDYVFNNRPVGRQYAKLIWGLTQDSPEDRMSIAEAKQELKFIQFLQMVDDAPDINIKLDKVIGAKDELKAKYQNTLDDPDKVEDMINDFILHDKISYGHKVMSGQGRSHSFKVKANSFKKLKNKFNDLKGDLLKTEILKSVKSELEKIQTPEQLLTFKKKFEKSDDYKVLKAGQGLTTKLFSLKTSSVEAYEKMMKERKSNLDSTQKHRYQ